MVSQRDILALASVTPVSLIKLSLKEAQERQRMAFERSDRTNFEIQLVVVATLERLLLEISAFCEDFE